MPHPDYDIDEMVLDAALQRRITAKRLTRHERVWVVGRLTELGYTVPQICDMLHLSRRTTQRLRARYRDDEGMRDS